MMHRPIKILKNLYIFHCQPVVLQNSLLTLESVERWDTCVRTTKQITPFSTAWATNTKDESSLGVPPDRGSSVPEPK